MMNILGQLGSIFYFIVLPILLLVAAGYVLQRRMGLDMATLTRLNFYFVIPALIYQSVVNSKVSGEDFLQVILFSLALMAGMAALSYVAARFLRVRREYQSVLMMTTLFYNSGNFALPLQDLAFQGVAQSAEAMSLQVFVMLVQNFTGFTLGVMLAASGQPNRHWKENLLYIVRFPPIYALFAALATVHIRTLLGPDLAATVATAIKPFWNGMTFARDAFMAIALVSLGAQMATLRPAAHRYPVTLSVILRLLAAPALAIGLIWLLGLHGLVAQVVIIGAGTPTAVNSMLLCLQFDNHPDYAARAVFYSTLLSPLTVTCSIFLAQQALPGWLW